MSTAERGGGLFSGGYGTHFSFQHVCYQLGILHIIYLSKVHNAGRVETIEQTIIPCVMHKRLT